MTFNRVNHIEVIFPQPNLRVVTHRTTNFENILRGSDNPNFMRDNMSCTENEKFIL